MGEKRPKLIPPAKKNVFLESIRNMGDERTGVDFPNNSTVYQEFLAEREEILRHKWLESEKAGKDIGFDRALIDWVRNHRSQWKAGRQV